MTCRHSRKLNRLVGATLALPIFSVAVYWSVLGMTTEKKTVGEYANKAKFETLRLTDGALRAHRSPDGGALGADTVNNDSMNNLPRPEMCTTPYCEWLQEQERRKSGIRESCNRLRNSSIFDLQYELTNESLKKLDHCIVVDSHRLIYCYLPKVACSSWKRVMLVLLGRFKTLEEIRHKNIHELSMPRLSKFSLEDARRRLDNYTLVMFTRDPFQRILSAYLDKFQIKSPGNRNVVHNVIRGIKPYMNPGKKIPDRSHFPNVTFPEFIRYVGDPKNIFSNVDGTEHWNEMYRMCQPCMIDYDYVGRFESLSTDTKFILNKMGLERLIVLPKAVFPTNASADSAAKTYIAQLSDGEKAGLSKRLETDASLFNYSLSIIN